MSKRIPISLFSVAMLVVGGCGIQPQIIQERQWQLNETIRATHGAAYSEAPDWRPSRASMLANVMANAAEAR